MSINLRVQKQLDDARASYAVLTHDDAFSAQEVAQRVHVKGRRLAKAVVFRDTEGSDFMVVMPASEQIHAGILRRATGMRGAQLEDERELARIFPDCEIGAIPPFGPLYRLPMFVDPCLLEGEDIFFSAGNHHEVVLLRTEEYRRIAGPFFQRGCLHAPHGALVEEGRIEEGVR